MAPEQTEGPGGRVPVRSEEDQYPPDWEERRTQVLQRDEFTCQLCGRRGGPYSEEERIHLHAHHTVPPSQGGSNDVDNLITLCHGCYEHHRQPAASASSDGGGGSARSSRLSLGSVLATWAVLVGMTISALEVLSTVFRNPIFGVEPVVALLAAVVLFALSVRLCSAKQWGPVLGTAAAILTWVIPMRTGGDLWMLDSVVQGPMLFGAAVVATLIPYGVAQHVDFAADGDDASIAAQGA